MERKTVRLIIVAVIIFAVLLFSTMLGMYTDWLFFQEVSYENVFLKILSGKILTGLTVGFLSFAFIFVNLLPVVRTQFPALQIAFNDQLGISLNEDLLKKLSRPVLLFVSIIIGILAGLWGSSLWHQILVFSNAVTTGVEDPILGKDVAFYLFKLPFYETVSRYAGFMIFVAFALAVAGYAIKGGFSVFNNRISIIQTARRHIGLLGGLFLLKIAFGFYLDRFGLLYSVHGVIVGAGYTDVHARLFALGLLAGLTALAGILFAVAFLKNSLKQAFYPLGAVVLVYVVGILIYPALLQNLKVAPNEIGAEKPFIENHISFTKFGYKLTDVEIRPFDVSYDLAFRDIANNGATIKNVPLWDEAPLLKTYSQLQQIRTYYKFNGINNDRYTLNGEYRQVMLSARELSYEDLPSKSWINERLVFTHGNGVAMGPVSRITRDGLPEFIMKDIPPVSNADIKITTPEIYFGELTNDYAIANTKIPEFNYPTSEGNVYLSYKGDGGVPLDSLFRRAVFASSFKTLKILLSSDIKKESRIIYNRNVKDRVAAIAPFLLLDKDPYIVISDEGKLFWMIDACTVSTRLPYSKRLTNRVNYMRNSVKVTVDAYNGDVNFYLSDPDDAVIKVYGAIFPGLLKRMEEMPADLKKHIRYPKEFFAVQTALYATYHMADPKTFYNKEDLWEIPSRGKTSMEPYYLIMKLPGEKKEEYFLFMPYTPAKRDNLAAWFAARCDNPDYGKLVVYTFPRDRLVFGPRQVDARIDQDSYISQQITLWGQSGSQVIRGNLLIIPIETSLMYIQPLYLAAEDKGGLPELRKVIVVYENNVVMEENLEICLQRLFGGRRPVSVGESPDIQKKTSIDDLAKEAMKLFERAGELQRQGNWAGYGEELGKLENVLKEMTKGR